MNDFYKVLGVEVKAPQADIKSAYRKLSKQYHPDLNPDNKEAENRFKAISEAYSTVGDPEKRKEYDLQRQHGASFGEGSNLHNMGFNPFGAGFNIHDFFNHHRRQRAPSSVNNVSNNELVLNLEIPFESVKSAPIRKIVKLTEYEECEKCNGLGGESKEHCNMCRGTGQIIQNVQKGSIRMTFKNPCRDCFGEGQKTINPCNVCGAVGTIPVKKKYDLIIKCNEIKNESDSSN